MSVFYCIFAENLEIDMAEAKQIPYGIADFRRIREKNYYYVDKTEYLARMERVASFLMFIRPRRFGKSLFLSMMNSYYDINQKDDFQKLFGDLWIGEHPTSEQGAYQMITLDFSRVVGSLDDLEVRFGEYLNIELDTFAHKYAAYYDPDFESRLHAIKDYVSKLNFINSVLNEHGEGTYHALTHASGFYRGIFKLFKGMFTRIMMMGVSPVTLDDLTSGYSIATNITFRRPFNSSLGLREDELRTMIRYYIHAGLINQDEDSIIEEMKSWYDHYCFSKESYGKDPSVYNSDMTMYYLNYLIQYGTPPEEMIDPNTRTDYTKKRKIIQLDQLDDTRKSLIFQIIEQGYVFGNVVESFPAEEMTKKEHFLSLLMYYGMLTIVGRWGAMLKLGIPNNNVRGQYYDFLLNEYNKVSKIDTSELNDKFTYVALKGEWQSLFQYISDSYKSISGVRDMIEGERNIQGFFTAYLSLSPYYLTAPEVELNHGYCDLFLMPNKTRYPEVAHSYIVELKYLAKDASAKAAAQQWEEAASQIRGYAQGSRVQVMTQGTKLHLLILQFKGYELIKMEEVSQNAR